MYYHVSELYVTRPSTITSNAACYYRNTISCTPHSRCVSKTNGQCRDSYRAHIVARRGAHRINHMPHSLPLLQPRSSPLIYTCKLELRRRSSDQKCMPPVRLPRLRRSRWMELLQFLS